ncbi:hypothetical protein VEZ01S_21_00840 [Vibrio ezurae NBRC 102218]|uniref:Oxidoreductase n=1 Tax=Vibrio ezurae NBRC 102218 TaxID=1219080 RepID=U3B1V9_9VIBR|nr:hypothetical protein VEZ01S_21_00840 [Vibrio ezurae NBRC 102218]
MVLSLISAPSLAEKFPSHAAYCGTKFAVHAISANVREEVAAANVRGTTIALSALETMQLSHTSSQEIKDGYDAWGRHEWCTCYR